MPVKLERALKRKAAAKGLTGERADAYTYGTLRKTGWKPSREKKMKAIQKRIIELNSKLDNLLEFAGNPEDPTAGMFGGTDPNILQRTDQDAQQSSALQRLKLKIATLRGQGLHS